jgi:hypothetical protein
MKPPFAAGKMRYEEKESTLNVALASVRPRLAQLAQAGLFVIVAAWRALPT